MRIHPTIITTVTLLMLALPASVAVAQEESAPPDAATTLAQSVFAGAFPAELGGAPWTSLTVTTGEASFETSSEEDRATMSAILEELDATIEDVAVLNAQQFNEDFSEYSIGSVLRVTDADAARLLELFLPEFAADFEDPMQEAGQVSGKDVTILYDATTEGIFGIDQPFYFYATGDTLYVVTAAEPKLSELLDALP